MKDPRSYDSWQKTDKNSFSAEKTKKIADEQQRINAKKSYIKFVSALKENMDKIADNY